MTTRIRAPVAAVVSEASKQVAAREVAPDEALLAVLYVMRRWRELQARHLWR